MPLESIKLIYISELDKYMLKNLTVQKQLTTFNSILINQLNEVR